MNSVKNKLLQRFRLSHYSLRDILAVGIPALLLIAAGFYITAQFIRPAPSKQLVMSTGSAGGAYESFALRYKDVLARYGIELELQSSAGAIENLARLRAGEVDAGFIQSGIDQLTEGDEIETLGSLYYEPLWIFYRSASFKQTPVRLTELRGKRIAIGAEGSGTRHLAKTLLQANGVSEQNTRLLPAGGLKVAEDLKRGRIDAVMT